MEEGRTDEACIKLGESFAQEASSGTLINLALCHETQGRLATAWAEYRSAARLAHTQGREDRASAAEEKALTVQPRLPYLTVLLKAPAQRPSVMLDHHVVGAGALGVPVPVDPGVRVVAASGAGLRTWTTSVELKEGERRSVEIPALEVDVAPPPSPTALAPSAATPPPPKIAQAPSNEPRAERGGGSATLGWVVTGAGVTSLALGTVFGLVSLRDYRSADQACPKHVDCPPGAMADRRAADTTAWLSNIAFGVGAIATGVGVVLLLRSDSDAGAKHAALRATPLAGGAWVGIDDAF